MHATKNCKKIEHRFQCNLTEAAPRSIQHHQPRPRPPIRGQCIDLLQGQVHHTFTCEYVWSILAVAGGCGSGAPRDGGHVHLVTRTHVIIPR